MIIKNYLLLVFITIFTFLLLFSVYSEENLIKNPSFESGSVNRIEGWYSTSYFKEKSTHYIDATQAHDGKRSVCIINKEANDTRMVQDVSVNENTLYKFSAWIKTENIGDDAIGANLSIHNQIYCSRDIRGTTQNWEHIVLYVKTSIKVKKLPVTLSLGGYGSINKGKAFFDDVSLIQVSKLPKGANVFTVRTPEDERKLHQQEKEWIEKTGLENGIVPIIIVVILSIIAVVFLAGIIILIIKFKLYKKLPDKLAGWFSSFFKPQLTEYKGLKKVFYSPYIKLVLIIIAFLILGVPFLHDILESFEIEKLPGNENHYLHLARAFLNGRLDIPVSLHDTASFNNKVYVIYPPFPVLFVLPFVAIFGLSTSMTGIGIFLALVSCILLYRILIKINIEKKYRMWILLAFFLGTGYWLCLRDSLGVAWFAHVAAVFALLLTLHEAFGRGNGFLVGLFLGMAFLSRQLSIFFALLFVVLIWTNKNRKNIKEKISHLAFFFCSLGVCVVLYLIYNYARFGNFFDTGYEYLKLSGFMDTRTSKYGQFSIFHIPFNFVYMFIQGFHINYGDWPDWVTSVNEYWAVDAFGTAITFASPFVFYSIWAKEKKSFLIAAWISIAIVCLGGLMYYNNGWVQYNTQRFSLDFLPVLMLLVALGIQHGKKPFWKPLIIYSVALNAFTMLIIPGAS